MAETRTKTMNTETAEILLPVLVLASGAALLWLEYAARRARRNGSTEVKRAEQIDYDEFSIDP